MDFRRNIKGEESAPAADKVVKGEPKTVVKNYFSDPSGQFFAGTWSSSVGKWKIEYTENEFCHLLEGRVRDHLRGRKALAIQRGRRLGHSRGLQRHLGDGRAARKRYAIFEAAKPGRARRLFPRPSRR